MAGWSSLNALAFYFTCLFFGVFVVVIVGHVFFNVKAGKSSRLLNVVEYVSNFLMRNRSLVETRVHVSSRMVHIFTNVGG